MRVLRLVILPLLISVCVAAQVPGNIRLLGNRYVCIEPESAAVQPAWIKNLFLCPVLFQQLPTTAFRQDGISQTHIIPPPEFRAHDLTMVDASRVSRFRSFPGHILCHGVRSDAQGRFHGSASLRGF